MTEGSRQAQKRKLWKRIVETAAVIGTVVAIVTLYFTVHDSNRDDRTSSTATATASALRTAPAVAAAPTTPVTSVTSSSASAASDREIDATDLRTGSGQYDVDTVKVDGVRYPNSIAFTQWAMYDGGTASFDLGRNCTRLTVLMGFEDDARTGATADMYIKGDDRTLWSRSYSFGDRGVAVDLDVSDVLRLVIGGTYDMNGAGSGGPAAGSPKLLCHSV